MKNNTENFEELVIPRKDINLSSAAFYRVYRDNRYFELIEAVSALDAISKSKIDNIYKVERHNPMAGNVIHFSQAAKQDAKHGDSTNFSASDNEKSTFSEQNLESSVGDVKIEEKPVENKEAAEIAEVQVSDAASSVVANEQSALSNDEVDRLLNG